MLLTSGQVSVAISSVVVILFTAALFLSGYVLQQKTVRDIRTAIRPQVISMQDRLYLPPQFENPTIQVLQDEESELVINMRQGSSSDHVGTKKVKKTKEGIPSSERVAQQGSREVQDRILPMDGERPVQEENEVGPPPDSDPASHSEDTPEEKPLSRAERRRKIKEEILAVGEGDGFKGYRRRMW